MKFMESRVLKKALVKISEEVERGSYGNNKGPVVLASTMLDYRGYYVAIEGVIKDGKVILEYCSHNDENPAADIPIWDNDQYEEMPKRYHDRRVYETVPANLAHIIPRFTLSARNLKKFLLFFKKIETDLFSKIQRDYATQ